ncbi:ABC-2 type transport system ATP-binding protein [Knoellia remsis]|uniref:ABC-2 type transport system ATP-binding protein n=1 Tax=Knoellia remsis TaxID=407159 RepID=A0A2T0UQI4_9MICO|nr:ABC transporter ATP-binding protein [Knoellia remsis]PRY60128.1 ABC-2 type transport system ATP-binding protein [Knoellia remsis]
MVVPVNTVIETRDLRKTFGPTVALDGLDLTVPEGEVHGFLGPNGAGKSTTIRILLGLTKADSGEARLLGGDPWRDATELHRRVAYVPGDVALWPNLTGGETIDVLARLRGGIDERRRAELIERFELDPTKKARSYSKGNRQKVALVAALASDAPLLILDEPTSGLDPLMERVFQDELRAARERGHSVLLSSHILSEVEHAAERVSIVRAGRIVETGTLTELRHLSRSTVHAVVRTPVGQDISGWPGIEDVVVDEAGTDIRFSVDAEHVGDAVGRLDRLGITNLTCEPASLEDLFLAHYAQAPESVTV